MSFARQLGKSFSSITEGLPKKISHYFKKATAQSIYVAVGNKTYFLQKYSIWTERHPGQEPKDIIRKLQSKDVISG